MKYLPVLEKAYCAILSIDPIKKLEFQSELVELRNAIAEITGEDIEKVQEKFESQFVESITFYGSMVGRKSQPYEFMRSIHYAK